MSSTLKDVDKLITGATTGKDNREGKKEKERTKDHVHMRDGIESFSNEGDGEISALSPCHTVIKTSVSSSR